MLKVSFLLSTRVQKKRVPDLFPLPRKGFTSKIQLCQFCRRTSARKLISLLARYLVQTEKRLPRTRSFAALKLLDILCFDRPSLFLV